MNYLLRLGVGWRDWQILGAVKSIVMAYRVKNFNSL